jgi:hypothetical protein
MDKILESLKFEYTDMAEEQRICQIVESFLLNLKEADLNNPDEESEDNIEDPNSIIDEPLNDTPTQEPVDEPKVNTSVSTLPPQNKQLKPEAPKKDMLPDISNTSQPVPTPAKPAAKPVAKSEPIKPTPKQTTPQQAGAPKPELTPAPTVEPTGDVEGYKKKLLNFKKNGKILRANINGSTAFSRIQYNPKTSSLVVDFAKNGRAYKYKNVPLDVASQLFAANSKGQFYNQNIKDVYTDVQEIMEQKSWTGSI